MQARIREVWERVKGTGIDLLTEGIRLVQAAGEQLLQQIADRRLHVPDFVHGALERLVGHASPSPPEEVEFVCRPAGSDRFTCEPVTEAPASAGGDGAVPKASRRRAAAKRPSKRPAVAPKRPRRKRSKPSVPPSADGIDAS
ncbi:MAG: hypothetical protein JXB32_21285 [Deltaproteobacteria bacterium]|nr:hypothetical protein [Deltaproteobacteria bacterium]